MTDTVTGFAAEANKSFDSLTNNNLGQLSDAALALLMEGQTQFKAEPQKTSSLLPEISFAQGARRPGSDATNNPNLAMGNPSNATSDIANANNYLLVKDQYVMSYNRDYKTPNWVSWQLNQDWMGSSGRSNAFAPDQSLPASFDKTVPADYKGSGYDRGHNVPSGDRTRSREDNEATFLMTNITPQTADNNQGPWEKLESYSRELAKQGKELYIIAGSDGSKGTIGNHVNVPTEFWKVIVVLPQKGMGPADVTANTPVIAVQMPNVNGIKGDDWKKYITSVSSIERSTGHDLLSNLPDDIEKVVSDKKFGN